VTFKSIKLIFALVLTVACSSGGQQWIHAWKELSPLNIPRAGGVGVRHGKYLFVLGGVDGKNFLSSIERSIIRKDGELERWKVVGNLPDARGFFDALIVGNRLFVVGGANGANGQNLLATVFSAEINAKGELGDWKQQSSMSLPRRCVKVFALNGRLYAAGGFAGSLLDSLEYSEIDKEGNLGVWKMDSRTLTIPRYVNALKSAGNSIFVLGGHHEKQGTGLASVERLDRSSDHWSSMHPMQQGRYALSAIVAGNYLFAMGGISGAKYFSSIEYFSQESGVWKYTTDLPVAMANFSTIEYDDAIYVIGGTGSSQYHNSVYYAQVNNEGGLGVWGTRGQAASIVRLPDTLKEDVDSRLPNLGKAIDVIDTQQYTYILVEDGGESYWIAGPVTKVLKGDVVSFSQGAMMTGFYSNSLQRTFPKILFVGEMQTQNR